ncbi:MAG: DUF4405 domain-containing protein [Ruminococcus sp.]|nr:DUF4405 domain-containing protein [Ruminococcus sp.]
MDKTLKIKIEIDLLLTLSLLFLMLYELIGEAAHEWIGIGMFTLFILHHIMNRNWSKSLFKGKYTAFCIVQTALIFFIFACMTLSMVSGMILSRHVFVFLNIKKGTALAQRVHMTCAYWGFVLMSLHLGFHWNMVVNMAGRLFEKPSVFRKWTVRAVALIISSYGIYAFIKCSIGSYMLMQVHFVFFDYGEPVAYFILDYMVAMGLFVIIGYYLSICLKGRIKA